MLRGGTRGEIGGGIPGDALHFDSLGARLDRWGGARCHSCWQRVGKGDPGQQPAPALSRGANPEREPVDRLRRHVAEQVDGQRARLAVWHQVGRSHALAPGGRAIPDGESVVLVGVVEVERAIREEQVTRLVGEFLRDGPQGPGHQPVLAFRPKLQPLSLVAQPIGVRRASRRPAGLFYPAICRPAIDRRRKKRGPPKEQNQRKHCRSYHDTSLTHLQGSVSHPSDWPHDTPGSWRSVRHGAP